MPLFNHYSAIHPLSWDVVQFNLPNAIHFWQIGTFWRIDPGFGVSYPYGYELSIIWPIVFMRSEALIGWMHFLYAIACLVYLICILSIFLRSDEKPWKELTYLGALIAWGVIPEFRDILDNIGKNDVSIIALGSAALYFLLRYSWTKQFSFIVCLGIALGLMTGYKPTGIIYLILFMGLVFSLSIIDRFKRGVGELCREQILLVSLTVVLGSFWYIRNYLVLGMFYDIGLARIGWERNIITNLLQSNFHIFDRPFWFLIISALLSVNLTGLFAIRIFRGNTVDKPYLVISLAFIGSVLILGLMPFGTWPTPPSLQIRYGGIMIPLLIIFISLGVRNLMWRLIIEESADGWIIFFRTPDWFRVTYGLIICLLIVILMYSQQKAYQYPYGLSGYEHISPQFDAEIGAYRWVQESLRESSLYSLSVIPYGILGTDFSNRVVYNLNPEQTSKEEVWAVVEKYQADYLLIGKNLHIEQPTAGQFPSILTDIDNAPQFLETYRDTQVVIFRVVHDCAFQFSQGWYGTEREGSDWLLWSGGQGYLKIIVNTPIVVTLTGDINSAQRPNKVDLFVNDDKFITFNVDWDEWAFRAFTPVSLSLKAGENIVEFSSHNPAIALSTESRMLSIAVKNLNLITEQGITCELLQP